MVIELTNMKHGVGLLIGVMKFLVPVVTGVSEEVVISAEDDVDPCGDVLEK